jgi:hypothetical protein
MYKDTARPLACRAVAQGPLRSQRRPELVITARRPADLFVGGCSDLSEEAIQIRVFCAHGTRWLQGHNGEMGFPSGTVTLLFTDVEGSIGLWEADGEAMAEASAGYDRIVREQVELPAEWGVTGRVNAARAPGR